MSSWAAGLQKRQLTGKDTRRRLRRLGYRCSSGGRRPVALAFLAAVFHIRPVGPPLFAVLEGPAASDADFGG